MPATSGVNATNLTMPIDISQPILDCSYWNSPGVSSQVTFICFQKKFNFELFLAITGGLLSFALIVLNTSIGLLLRITQCCMTKLNLKHMFKIRMVFIGIVILVELAMVILCLVLGITRVSPDSINDDPGMTFLTMHATEILAVVSIVATLLWLPWEEYVEEQNKHQNGINRPAASQPDLESLSVSHAADSATTDTSVSQAVNINVCE